MLALWGTLFCAKWLDIDESDVYGDSKVTVEWANQRSSLGAHEHTHWIDRIQSLIRSFSRISVSHIFREQNSEVDTLSKAGCVQGPGKIYYSAFCRGIFQRSGEIDI